MINDVVYHRINILYFSIFNVEQCNICIVTFFLLNCITLLYFQKVRFATKIFSWFIMLYSLTFYANVILWNIKV